MDKPTKYIKKYPKSDKGYQCLGPCYDKYVTSVHPITFDVITSKNPYCPVAGYQSFYPSENKFKITYQDKCNDDNNTTMSTNDEIYNNLLPYMDFNIKDFLSMFYEINTFEDGINWISNNSELNIKTKNRIFECILNVFGKNIDIVDNRIVDIVIDIVKSNINNNMTHFYKSIKKYIYIDVKKNTVEIKKNIVDDTNKETEKDNIIKTNFVIKTFINQDIMQKFLFKYFKIKKNEWDDIYEHIDDINNEFEHYIINLIKVSN